MRKFITLLLALFALAGSAIAQDEATPVPVIEWAEQYYAPYVYGYPAFLLAPTAEATGIRYFTLGFVLSNSSKCQAIWGNTPVNQPSTLRLLGSDLEKLRAMGGDVMASFGGAGGVELAQICTDVDELAAQYQSVIDLYGITRLDFDIEGDDIREPEAIERRSQAIAMIQSNALANGSDVFVSFTLPVQPTGLTTEGIAVLASAIEYGVRIDVVNIMTMNFGQQFPVDQMGANTIQAAESLFAQLQELYPDKTEAELWMMIGLTPMIGINDRPTQFFQLTDAELVTDFALEKGIRSLSMWSLNRDQQCDAGAAVSNRCSAVEQEPFAFSQILNRVTTTQ